MLTTRSPVAFQVHSYQFSRPPRSGQHPAQEIARHTFAKGPCGNRREDQRLRGTDMAWGNAVLSENQNDFEACLSARSYEADIPTRVPAEPPSLSFFSPSPSLHLLPHQPLTT